MYGLCKWSRYHSKVRPFEEYPVAGKRKFEREREREIE